MNRNISIKLIVVLLILIATPLLLAVAAQAGVLALVGKLMVKGFSTSARGLAMIGGG